MEKRFSIEQKSLLSVLAAMQPICTKRTTLETTSCIYFHVGHRELVLKSTDLEISLQASCAINDSTITNAETFLVPGRRIFDIVRELDGIIDIVIKDNQIALNAGPVKLTLHIKDAQEFPPFPERIENLMHIDASMLNKMLESVAFLIPQNNANPALNGMLLEVDTQSMMMTATDGHCLVQTRSKQSGLEEAKTWLLPKRAVFELKKVLESCTDKAIFIGICGNQLVFSGELFNFFTKLLADPFPQYRQILDKTSFQAATVERSRFAKTLRRSASLLSGHFLATRFGFAPHAIRVTMQNKDVGTMDEELPVEGLQGDAIDIRFYAPYLLNGLQSINESTVTFYLKNSAKPIIFESSEEGIELTYLVMPVSSTSHAA